MSLGNLKKLQAAERLLKQGKTAEALERLDQLAKAAPNDVLTINRMGDLLARQGRTAEAIGYYFQIAGYYTDGGYLPKAVAIYKKIVRLDPKSSVSLFRLGQLYLKQKLPAEALRFLGTAAQLYEEAGDHAGAREAYEALVEADGSNPEYRARLADTMAAGGDTAAALTELLHLGDTLQRGGRAADAEQIYRKAAELDPASLDAVLGIAHALTTQSDLPGAIACLEPVLEREPDPMVMSALAVAYERAGRGVDTVQLLQQPGAQAIPDSAMVELLEHAIDAGQADELWTRLDRVFAAWQNQGHGERVTELLERLTHAEDPGHVPALVRYERALIEAGHTAAATRVLDKMVTVYRAAGDTAAAEQAAKRLQQVSPTSAMPSSSPSPAPAAAGSASGGVPSRFEVPAVPLSRADKEFVTGRLTQAEILEKYSLMDQAQAQVLEVTARFPGHVGAQQRLLAMRRGGDPTAVRDTLISLALACRAAGDLPAAGEAAREARELGGRDPQTEKALQDLGLFGDSPAAPAEVALPKPAAPPAAVAAPGAESTAPEGLLIDFDDEAAAEEPTPAAAGGQARAPGPDMLSEIRQHLQQGRPDEARKEIMALETLGYGSDELDRLSAQTQAALAAPTPAAESEPSAEVSAEDAALLLDLDEADDALLVSDGDDLSTITAALESEAEPEKPLKPDAGSEQSVEEVFAAFREAVSQEVGDEPRTHYDLAIGYKEMGLLDEAIEGFTIAARSVELVREANLMLALCHREQGQLGKAVEHYRKAAGIGGQDAGTRATTLYDLAETLMQAGEESAALDELRRVLELDPGYRDVRQRVDDLETRLQG